MPDRRAPTAAERSEALVQSAAERAVALALAGSRQEQGDAVARALRDERVDRALRDHEDHLGAINGSQGKMANSLRELVETHKTQLAVTGALSKQLENQAKGRFSRWSIWVGVALALAAYGGIIATIVTANS